MQFDPVKLILMIAEFTLKTKTRLTDTERNRLDWPVRFERLVIDRGQREKEGNTSAGKGVFCAG